MPGAMRKMAVYLGLVEDEERDGYDDYADDGDADSRDSRDGREGRYDRDERDPRRESPREQREGRDGHRDGHGQRDGGASRVMTAVRDEPRGTVAAMADRRTAPSPRAQPVGALDRITTIHPRAYNDAKIIGESFRDGTPVIMNLTDMSDPDAKRLVDFAAGLVFGLHGTIERVTNKVFLLSPANVTVTAEDKARIAESGFFNQS